MCDRMVVSVTFILFSPGSAEADVGLGRNLKGNC